MYKVNDAAHFHEWAEHMKKDRKDIGELDLILICIPDRDHDETYQSIKVLTELNYGKIKCLWSLKNFRGLIIFWGWKNVWCLKKIFLRVELCLRVKYS